jgi:hypothetical protein
LFVAALAVMAVAGVFSPAASWASGSVTKTVTQDGLTVTLTATPEGGGSVRFSAHARTEHATGAWIYSLAYGDGSTSRPVAIPQYCLAGAGRPATGSWNFTHQYRKSGRYAARFTASVNCSGEHATVQLTLSVRS